MSQFAIEIEGLGKQYQRRERKPDGSLRGWLQQLGKQPVSKEVFWALKELNATVAKGDVVGIVGRNGSGKSTLLKLLSRISPPSAGKAILQGRVASLLEVGTGFHHELTGRENIYLNGAILGMKRQEINACYKDIAEFSGVADFIDEKVKNYSSGMYVRLAFSVAAHLRTDILLIDEVLAVGDAEFQKRSLGKMNEMVRQEERTILFVSHNLPLVRQLCNRCIGLDAGQSFSKGPTEQVLSDYEKRLQQPSSLQLNWTGSLAKSVQELNISLNGLPLQHSPVIDAQSSLVFETELIHKIQDAAKLQLSVFRDGIRLFTIQDRPAFTSLSYPARSKFSIAAGQLRPGIYQITFGGFAQNAHGPRFFAYDLASFTIRENWFDETDRMNTGWVNLNTKGEVLSS